MKPGKLPWIDVPGDWLDSDYSRDREIEKLQRFLRKKVKADVIRTHLLAEGIGKPGALEIVRISVRVGSNEATVKANINVTGQAWKIKNDATGLYVENDMPEKTATGAIKLERTLSRNDRGEIHTECVLGWSYTRY